MVCGDFLWKKLWFFVGDGCGIMRVMAFIRKFKTGSGATGVQVCWKERGKVVKTVHVGSASTEKHLVRLLREAEKIKNAGKQTLFDLDKFNK